MAARKKRATDERALVTDVPGAGVMLNKSRDGIYELIHKDELESYLDGRARRITIASIKGYIERKLASASTFERARYPTARGANGQD